MINMAFCFLAFVSWKFPELREREREREGNWLEIERKLKKKRKEEERMKQILFLSFK